MLTLLVSTNDNSKNHIGQIVVSTSNVLKCDLVIVGSRGLGKLEKFFMGSVSRFVVENAHIPVLVVKE